MVLPTGTGKSHSLIGVGYRAVERGLPVRYFVAADLVEALYRGLADNTVGQLIHTVLRNDLVLIDELGFAPLDETDSQLLFALLRPPTNIAAWLWPAIGPFEQWGTFLPVQTTAASLLDRLLHHAIVVVTSGESFRMKEARARGAAGRSVPPSNDHRPALDRR